MFPHPRPDVRALDASASIPPSWEAIPCAFILFTHLLFLLFAILKRVTKRWNSNVLTYTFTLFKVVYNMHFLLKSLKP